MGDGMTREEIIEVLRSINTYWDEEKEAIEAAITALQAQEDMTSRQAAIDTEGLDAQIRCEMCRNPMHTDRGCDGNCKYDEKLYEKIMQILGERIKPLPSAQPKTSTARMTFVVEQKGE